MFEHFVNLKERPYFCLRRGYLVRGDNRIKLYMEVGGIAIFFLPQKRTLFRNTVLLFSRINYGRGILPKTR